jgi:hypothetical protein
MKAAIVHVLLVVDTFRSQLLAHFHPFELSEETPAFARIWEK